MLGSADDLVEFYDPTDVFGDLADALAEAYPAIVAGDEGEADQATEAEADADAADVEDVEDQEAEAGEAGADGDHPAGTGSADRG